MKMNLADKLAWVLIIIGGLNWGFVGWWNKNLVDKVVGSSHYNISRIIYAIVGAAALYSLVRMVMMMSSSSNKA